MKKLLLCCLIATSCAYAQENQSVYTIDTGNKETICTLTILDDLDAIQHIGNFEHVKNEQESTWPCMGFLQEHVPVLIKVENEDSSAKYQIKGIGSFVVSKEKLTDIYNQLRQKPTKQADRLFNATGWYILFDLLGIAVLASGWIPFNEKYGPWLSTKNMQKLTGYPFSAPTNILAVCVGAGIIAITSLIFGINLEKFNTYSNQKNAIEAKEKALLDKSLFFIKKDDLEAFKKAIPTITYQEIT